MKFENKEALDKYIKEEAEKQAQELIEKERKAAEEKAKAEEKADPPAPEPSDIEVGVDRLSLDTKGGFVNVAEFARDVAIACKKENMAANYIPPKLLKWNRAIATNKTLSTDVGESGGHLIPTAFSMGAFNVAVETNPIMPLVTEWPMTTNSLDLTYVEGFDQSGNLIGGGIIWYWKGEGKQGTFSDPKFGVLTLKLKDCIALCRATNDMLEDNPGTLETVLNTLFVNGLNFQLTKVLIEGSGVGQPLGVMNSGKALVTIPKETSQPADTMEYMNVLKMFAQLYEDEAATSATRWHFNRDCIPQIATMKVDVGLGGAPVWTPPGVAPASILGYPIAWSKHCATLGDLGDGMLVNWRHYYVGMKGGIRSAQSMHLYFDYNDMAFRWTFRIDGKPSWPQAFKGPKSAKPLSPFITLAERA
ncbi:MAG: phage major capsid protein [Deltaproteobacteria bacterium]|uniref:Phage major capsid protein n=1 Tax=Candidatus Zymogenus saltonus TaxID=2844893 RepID=A0A9D8PS39_9DELT|nr:phage major capsid protein [Candidatus Zymogenus saltonus]